MHLNRDYRFDGLHHDLPELFKGGDVTKQLTEFEATLSARLTEQREALSKNSPPEISPGPQCSAPYGCEFFRHCNAEPPQNHIRNLPRLSDKKRNQLEERG